MEVIRAKHMGFCFGVMEAINICESLIDEKANKYILGMIVHNENVVSELIKKGFKILEEEELLKNSSRLKKGDIVIIRAHGTSKQFMKILLEKEVKIYDATCIFVNNIKNNVVKAIEEGYDILFVGDKNHPEVKGIISYADHIQVFENLEAAKELKIEPDKKYFYLLKRHSIRKNLKR